MDKGNIYGVILAGGRGERFWPKSRRGHPKQLLSIIGQRTMLEETKERVLSLIPQERLLIVSTEGFEELIKNALPDIPEENFLFEPRGRNTAPAIAYASERIYRESPQSKMVVLPADHHIVDGRKFLKTLRVALEIADADYLVTFGIVPARPETGYGYIEVGEEIAEKAGVIVHRSMGFKEKPNQKQAKGFLKAGRYLWNSGMFVWKTEAILKSLEEHMLDLSADFKEYRKSLGTAKEKSTLKTVYEKTPSTSIDYGVMERAPNVAVVKADFSWDDVGDWSTLERLKERNSNGNVVLGDHLGIETKNSVIVSESGLVATVGVSDLVIVRVEDTTLVCSKERVQDVKTLVQRLSEDEGLSKYA